MRKNYIITRRSKFNRWLVVAACAIIGNEFFELGRLSLQDDLCKSMKKYKNVTIHSGYVIHDDHQAE